MHYQKHQTLYYLFFLVLIYYVDFINSASFPKVLSRCHKNDTKHLKHCLGEKMLNAIRIIEHDGLPELNMKSIEPLHVHKLQFDKDATILGLDQMYENIKVYYIGKIDHITIKKLTFEPDKIDLQALVHIPNVTVTTDLTATGQLVSFPIKAKGLLTMVVYDVSALVEIIFEFNEKHSTTYLNIKDFKLKLSIKRVSFDFQNKLNLDVPIDLNLILNDNGMSIYNDVEPAITEALAMALKKYANSFFQKVPYHEIFMD